MVSDPSFRRDVLRLLRVGLDLVAELAPGRMHLCPGGFGKREAGAPEHGDEQSSDRRGIVIHRGGNVPSPLAKLFQDL
jgi:hypothetical protein